MSFNNNTKTFRYLGFVVVIIIFNNSVKNVYKIHVHKMVIII